MSNKESDKCIKQFEGQIHLITGCMFAGKSSALINIIERYLIAKKKCVILKWKGDIRYGKEEYVIAHSGKKMTCIVCDDKDLETIYPKISKYEVIGIDEGSFFKSIVDFSEYLANKGHLVIVSSLVGTFERKGFNDILNLIPKCEKIIHLNAVCMKCFKDGASFSKRITSSKDIEMVGGSESYIAVCRKCSFNEE